MSFRADRRAQSIQIGALLLFAVLIILFATYQAFVVPSENRQIEANHADTVATQMLELRNQIVSIPATGEGSAVRVKLGTTYPARVIALNPSAPTGTIRTSGTTTADVNVSVANAVGTSEEIADFWDGTDRSYNSGSLRYRANYNEFRNAPTIIYDNTMLVHQFREGNLTRASQRLLDGERISLTTINGSLDRGSSGATTLDLEAVSASNRRISITNEPGESIFLSIASQFDAAQWQEELSNSHVVSVTDDPIPGTSFQLVRIELERDVTYTLRLSRIGMGTGVVGTDASYITAVSGRNVEQNETFTAEVRDRFNNPVSSVDVIPASTPAGCNLQTKTTDEAGRVEYECAARGNVRLEINGGTTDAERITFGIPVLDETPPSIDEATTQASSQTEQFCQAANCNDPLPLSQVTAEYDLSDAESGLDHVYLALRDGGDNLVTETSIDLEGDTTRTGTWIAPWVEASASEISGYSVLVRGVDRGGNDIECVADVGSGSCTVQDQPANFDVSITGTNEPVEEGDTLQVTADVENTGDLSDTQDIALDIDGSQQDLQSVQLDGGETQTLTLEWSTTTGDAGDYTATVTSEDDSASTPVSVVVQQAQLQINNVRGLTDQDISYNYQVDVDVEETADVQTDNFDVRLVIEGNSEGVVFDQTISPSEIQNEETTVQFDVGQLPADDYQYTVTADADNAQSTSQSGTFTVSGPTFTSLEADVTGTEGPDSAANEVTISYEVSGSPTDIQFTVTDANGNGDSTTVTSNFGASDEVITWNPGPGPGPAPDNYPVTITADIGNGECLTADIQSSTDVVTLADGDWSEC